ncbi:MAG: DUF72 domain-containing protein [Acidimicrobiia bacterium]|nr:DUF72 domain-containing protein [Acidimicrobiia bacterium]
MADVSVGTSGWSYKEWVGSLYPTGTAAARLLPAYAQLLPTVEAHNTFRRRPRASTLEDWAAAVPDGFLFALKAHVAITHQRDLAGVEDRIANFFEALRPLGAHVGPVLFQLPHRDVDLDRLDRLLGALPPAPPTAFELGPAWNTPEVLTRLDAHGATLVVADRDSVVDSDSVVDEPELPDVGPIAYVRLRRDRYDDAALARWASRLDRSAAAGRPVFAYLRHEGDPREAVRLLAAVRA